MDQLLDITMALHYLGLAMGGAAAFGLPVVGARIEASPPEHRPSFGPAMVTLKKVGKAGMGLLILTGLVLATLGSLWGFAPAWFWLKLALVAALIASIVAADKAGDLAMAGDAAAAARVKLLSKTNLGLLMLILIFAALSFH